MGKFLEEEKKRQIPFKRTSGQFTGAARADGVYRRKPRPFCLPEDHARENLFTEIRDGALNYFKSKKISWHDGTRERPSNHLCSSQVQCVNFLYPFSDKRDALCDLLRPIFPDIESIVPMKCEQGLVAFEWIGLSNYLGERIPRNGRRTRGANATSADAAVMVTLKGGKRQILLIEWKYTESYTGAWLGKAKSGTSRMDIYRPLYDKTDCPVDKTRLPNFSDLFYEPFYQFFRQQLLAHEMERAQESGAELVTVLHIAPARNRDFHKVTSPALAEKGSSSIEVWKDLLRQPDRFISVSQEELFGNFPVDRHQGLANWWQYTSQRYSWLQGRDTN